MQPAVTPLAGRLVEQQREPSAQVPQYHPPLRASMARSSGGPSGRHLSKQEWHRPFRGCDLPRAERRRAGGPRYMRLETIVPMIYDSGLPAVAS